MDGIIPQLPKDLYATFYLDLCWETEGDNIWNILNSLSYKNCIMIAMACSLLDMWGENQIAGEYKDINKKNQFRLNERQVTR